MKIIIFDEMMIQPSYCFVKNWLLLATRTSNIGTGKEAVTIRCIHTKLIHKAHVNTF